VFPRSSLIDIQKLNHFGDTDGDEMYLTITPWYHNGYSLTSVDCRDDERQNSVETHFKGTWPHFSDGMSINEGTPPGGV
jgi:hypothetical protein